MKLKNRIMSWILSPGAYAVWHSMGAPEEWQWDSGQHSLIHKATGVGVNLEEWWRLPMPVYIIPVCWPAVALAWALWPLFLDCDDPHSGAIGYLERHLIAGRAMRLRGKLVKGTRVNHRKRRNTEVFTKLTVNQ